MNSDEEPKECATKIVDALSKLIELFDPKTLTKTQRFTVIYTLVQIGSLVFVLEFVDLGAHRDALVAFIVVATYFLMTWVLLLCLRLQAFWTIR